MRHKGAEVVSLRGRCGATGVTLIGAYVTPNRTLTDTARATKVAESIRSNTLKAITSIAETARERGDCVALLGDLNIGFSDGQLVEIDGPYRGLRSRDNVSLTTPASREEFETVKKWNLVLRSGQSHRSAGPGDTPTRLRLRARSEQSGGRKP